MTADATLPILRATLAGSRVRYATDTDVFEQDFASLDAWLEQVQLAWNDAWQASGAPVVPRSLVVRGPFPPDLVRHLATLASSGATLLIDAEGALSQIPWELMPSAFGIAQLAIARLAPSPSPPAEAPIPTDSRRALVICAGEAMDRRDLASVTRVLERRYAVTVLENPTLDAVRKACQEQEPSLVHLVTRTRRVQGGAGFVLPVGGAVETHTAMAIAEALALSRALTLVTLNGCDTGLGAAAVVASHAPSAAVLGWYGAVNARAAADFAVAFYTGLDAGLNVMPALRAFSDEHGKPAPMVWTTSRANLVRQVATYEAVGPVAFTDDGDEERPTVSIDLELVSEICPAFLINGRSPVESLRLVSSSACDVSLIIVCDTGQGTSTWRETAQLCAGVRPIRAESLRFPILHELMARDVNRRHVNFTVSIHKDGTPLAEVTRSTLYLGPAEWLDRPGAWPFIPSYVLSDSEGTKRVVTSALAGLKEGSFTGYLMGGADAVDRQVRVLYEAMRDDLKLEYVNPPGAPIFVAAAESSALQSSVASGQRVRFPNEVVQHKRATCHDLALLLAACLEHIGLHPIILLIPGHTLLGYWRKPAPREAFWKARRLDSTREARFGDRWTFTDLDDLMPQVEAGNVRLVECTAVTRYGERLAFDAACQRALDHFERYARPLDCVVDVWASRAHVEPLFRKWAVE